MPTDTAVALLREAVRNILAGSLPIVGAGLLTGLTISILQAVTQVQEQTLTFVPKMIVVFTMIMVCAPWLFPSLVAYVTRLWGNIPGIIH